MKKRIVSVVVMLAVVAIATTPEIRNVTVKQRYPWNGKVDISYTVTGDIAEEARQRGQLNPLLKVTATDGEINTTYTATRLSGDTALIAGTHAFIWDMDEEGLPLKSSNVVFKVSCEATPATYCVIDLSAGANASTYPITYLTEPPSGGFNVDEYKTTKLVLRRLEAGTFKMLNKSNVTLTKPFFCDLFEVTQKQYELVTGMNPCSSTSYGKGDTYPVHYVSYNMIRGSSDGSMWPSSSAVDASSFMGKIRARTGLAFDLPTEAQWEYACRAGTTTLYSYGDSANGSYMWYNDNSCDTSHPVGMKRANPWGLYDMHGNVWEWCLDWFANSTTLTYGTDPQGPVSGDQYGRVLRGGAWGSMGPSSSDRCNWGPSSDYGAKGFRLVRTLSNVGSEQGFGVLCYGESGMEAINLESSTRTTTRTERIHYSTEWVSGAGGDAVAVVEVNGENLNTAIGNGYVDWTPMSNGTYTLTHRVMSGAEQIGETLTATFLVEGVNPGAPVFAPVSGTFGTSISVSISCPTEGTTIHYTTDGSEPTVTSPIYRRFRINRKMTVKAIAEKNGVLSEVATAEYALGQCDDPVIMPNDGTTFNWAGEQVSISWQGEDGVLRYTTDGSDPTRESPVYEGPFTISDSTIVKAKAFGDQFFDSAVLTASITRIWTDVAMPQIEAANSFTGSKTKVVISCATDGATIRYTTDGSEPDSKSNEYTGPFYVTDSCTVKAYAVKFDYRDSAVATQEIVKVWGIGDTMGKPDHGFTTDGSGGAGWTRVVDATAPNGEAMKSGAITHDQSSELSTTVMGPGTLSFSWRTSCEDDPLFEWDHVECKVDGALVGRLCGETAWTNVCVEIVGEGEHTVVWRYVKDDVESAGEDAACAGVCGEVQGGMWFDRLP